MKKKILAILQFLFFLAVAVLLLFLAFRGTDFRQIFIDLKHARYGWLLITIPLGVASHYFRALRWNLLIQPLGHKPKTIHTFYAVVTGYLANLALPRMGEIARCGSLNRTDRIPFDKLIGTVIIERSIDLMIVIMLFFLVIVLKFKLFGSFFKTEIVSPLFNRTGNLLDNPGWIALTVGIVLFLFIVLYIFWSKIREITLVRKFRDFLMGIVEGLKTLFRMEQKPLFLVYSLLIWFGYFLTSWLIVYTLPETSGLTPLDGLFLLVAGSLGMMVPVQGGIGAYHWIISSAVTIYGISRESGLALATIAHESQTLLILVVGTISLTMVVLIRRRQDKLAEAVPTEGTK